MLLYTDVHAAAKIPEEVSKYFRLTEDRDSITMLPVATTLLQLYISLVRPHLDYASAIWSPYLSKGKIELENIQKFACHMATGLWDTSYQDLLELVDLQHLNVEGWKLGSV